MQLNPTTRGVPHPAATRQAVQAAPTPLTQPLPPAGPPPGNPIPLDEPVQPQTAVCTSLTPPPPPPGLSQHEVEDVLGSFRSEHAVLGASMQLDKPLEVPSDVRQAFDAACPPSLLVERDRALQLFARYRTWAHALGMESASMSHWDTWVAGYAAIAGCTSRSARCVAHALCDRNEPEAAWLLQDNAIEALVRGQTDAFSEAPYAPMRQLPPFVFNVVGCALALRMHHASLTLPKGQTGTNAFVWRIFDALPSAARPILLPHLAQQPGVVITHMRAHTALRPEDPHHDAWLRAFAQLAPSQQKVASETSPCVDILAYATRDLVFDLIRSSPLWRAAYWRTDVDTLDLTAEDVPQLASLLPDKIDESVLKPYGPLAKFFPALHWLHTARRCVGGAAPPTTEYEKAPMRLLRACLDGDAITEGETPALQLARDPQAWVQRGDWQALAAPWLSQVLHKETPKPHEDARHAQNNRLHTLGCYLHVCNEAGIDPSQAPGPELLDTLLRLPNQAARRALLRTHLAHIVNDSKRDAWVRTVQGIFASHPSEHARALALALAGLHKMDVTAPVVRAILRSRPVAHAGPTATRLVHLATNTCDKALKPFVVSLFRWPDKAHLFALLTWAVQHDTWVTAAQSGDDAALSAAVASSECVSLTAFALLQKRWQDDSPTYVEAYLAAEHARLQGAAQWLQGQTDLQAMAKALQAYLANPSQTQLWDEAMAAARAVPRGTRRQLGEALCWQAKRAYVPGRKDKTTSYEPDDAFFQQSAVRQFFNRHVLPMLMRIQGHQGALTSLRKLPAALYTPQDLHQTCLSFLPEARAEADWETLAARLHNRDYLAMYWQSANTWASRWGDSRGAFHQLVQALLNDTYVAMRRTSAHMQQVLAHPRGQAIVAGWEPEHREIQELEGARYTVEDTAELSKMLAATSEISSCQSVHDRDGYNVAMLGRLQCGSKRMVTVRDAQGKLRARAALRLLRTEDGTPVVALSRVYAVYPEAHRYHDMLHAYVARRAAAMGVAALGYPYSGHRQYVDVTSETGAMPDYYDGGTGLSVSYRASLPPLPSDAAETHLAV